MKKTLVDEVLAYPVLSGKSTPLDSAAYKVIYNLLILAARSEINTSPPVTEPLPKDATQDQKENYLIYKALLSKRKFEHYSTFLQRVYRLATVAKGER